MGARDDHPPGVREIDHSGDIGLDVRAPTRRALLENATRGLCGLMTWSRVDAVSTRPIEVRAGTFPDLVVDWLSAVILSAATHAELYAGATLETAEEGVAAGVLHAAPLDPRSHQLRFDVKAATYHDLVVEETPDGFHARVIFDL
ncbi:MAG TPA: archease [Candidatus Krumholzibacteria bacterium]